MRSFETKRSGDLPCIAISIGDPAGIGPEVAYMALLDETVRSRAQWILIGEDWIFKELETDLGAIPHSTLTGTDELESTDGCLFWHAGKLLPEERTFGRVSAACGGAGLAYVRTAAELCLAGRADAMVTSPLNKEAVVQTVADFCGHTEYIAELCGVDESRMLLVNDRLCVAHVSTHISLADAAKLELSRVERTIELADNAYRRLYNKDPRIAVCGLNPHAGEHGLFGNHESKIIAPAIASARSRGLDCVGPYPADTLFLQAFRGAYDVVIAMYHDQGHIPMKLMDFEHTVNVTLGLPIIRTSVDHGTAFDIAGKYLASADDMKTAMLLAIKMAQRNATTA
jgi:4-phospho-D-threonate 3-dehydrogenase / 4-phospho-D-erythronate 3-dehydrogenase